MPGCYVVRLLQSGGEWPGPHELALVDWDVDPSQHLHLLPKYSSLFLRSVRPTDERAFSSKASGVNCGTTTESWKPIGYLLLERDPRLVLLDRNSNSAQPRASLSRRPLRQRLSSCHVCQPARGERIPEDCTCVDGVKVTRAELHFVKGPIGVCRHIVKNQQGKRT